MKEVDVVKFVAQERVQNHTVEQTVDCPTPLIRHQFAETPPPGAIRRWSGVAMWRQILPKCERAGSGRRDEGAAHGRDVGDLCGRTSVNAEDQRQQNSQQGQIWQGRKCRRGQKKKEKRVRKETNRGMMKSEKAAEDVMDWVEVRRKIRRRTAEGRHEEECRTMKSATS